MKMVLAVWKNNSVFGEIFASRISDLSDSVDSIERIILLLGKNFRTLNNCGIICR